MADLLRRMDGRKVGEEENTKTTHTLIIKPRRPVPRRYYNKEPPPSLP
jgi:hypothetical protein